MRSCIILQTILKAKKSNEIITNKLRNVDGLRDSQSEKKAVLTSFVIK